MKRHADLSALWWLVFAGLALVALSEASAVFELASKLLTIF